MKQILFWIVLIITAIFVAEILGYAAWSIAEGRLMGPQQIREVSQVESYTQEFVTGEEEVEGVEKLLPGYSARDLYLHPYFGYTNSSVISEIAAIHDDEETLCVLMMGGSVAQQVGDYIQYFREKLEATYPQYKQVRVYRLATAGFKQPQQLMQLNYLISIGKTCDIVINLDGFNEFHKSLANLSMDVAYIYPMSHNWTQPISNTNSYANNIKAYEIYKLVQRNSFLNSLMQKPLLRNSSIITFVGKNLSTYFAMKHTQLRDELARSDTNGVRNFAAMGAQDIQYPDKAAFYAQVSQVWKNASLAMQQLSELRGMRYFHFLQTQLHLSESRPQPHSSENDFGWSDEHIENLNIAYRQLRKDSSFLSENNVDYTDLTMIFHDEPEQVYIDTSHVTDLGKKMYIDAIVGHIQESF